MNWAVDHNLFSGVPGPGGLYLEPQSAPPARRWPSFWRSSAAS